MSRTERPKFLSFADHLSLWFFVLWSWTKTALSVFISALVFDRRKEEKEGGKEEQRSLVYQRENGVGEEIIGKHTINAEI